MGRRIVAVTGATGFVGTRVVAAARDAGWTVVQLVRPGRDRPDPDGDVRHLDLDDDEALRRAIAGAEVVVHAAAELRGGPDSSSVNVGGTRAVVRAVAQAGCRLVHLSTTSVYDLHRIGDVVVTEDAPLLADDTIVPAASSTGTAYAWSKVLAERAVADVPGAVLLRPPAVLGDGPTSTWGRRVPAAIAAGTWSSPHPDTTMGWVHVDDLAAAVVAAVDRPDVVGPVNVVAGHLTFGDWVESLGHPRPAPAGRAWRGRFAMARLHDLGLHPAVDVAEALARP